MADVIKAVDQINQGKADGSESLFDNIFHGSQFICPKTIVLMLLLCQRFVRRRWEKLLELRALIECS